jgi:hypothetical protein
VARARNRYRRGSNQDPQEQARQRLRAKGLPGAEEAEDEKAPLDLSAGISAAQAMRYAQQQIAAMGRSFGAIGVVAEQPRREPPVTRTGKALGFRSWKLDGYNLFSANAHFGGWKIDEPTEAVCYGGTEAQLTAAAAQLFSFGSSPLAPAKVQRAKPNRDHSAPHPGCGCGLYALHAPEFMSRWHQDEPLMVHGAVLGWGRMEVHREGWRAQYAQPVMLAFDGDRQPYNHCERVKAMGEELGLPVVEWVEFEAEARKLAEPVPTELRPLRTPAEYDPFGSWMGAARGGIVVPSSHGYVTNSYVAHCGCGTITSSARPLPSGHTCGGCGRAIA